MGKIKRRLVLFDIDGTILSGGRVWKEILYRSAESILGHSLGEPPVTFGGKTDPQICNEILEYLQHPEDAREVVIQRLLEGYLDEIERRIKSKEKIDFTKHPGVSELVHYLKQREGILLGLLTGNIERGAYLKLSLVELENEFKFGVFGSDHSDRFMLPAMAQKRALDMFGQRFEGQEIVIIGDTPNDINCGKSIGVRSIAVATGKTPLEELLKHDPHYSFKDLSQTEDVLAAILDDI